MSLISDLTDYLEDQGIGTIGTDLFDNYLPDNGTNGVAVIDTGGPEQDHHIPTGQYTFQIYIRHRTYALAKASLDSVRTALHQVVDTTIGSTHFMYIMAASGGGLTYDGRGDNNNKQSRGLIEMSINFQCLTR